MLKLLLSLFSIAISLMPAPLTDADTQQMIQLMAIFVFLGGFLKEKSL